MHAVVPVFNAVTYPQAVAGNQHSSNTKGTQDTALRQPAGPNTPKTTLPVIKHRQDSLRDTITLAFGSSSCSSRCQRERP
jgi:hypothetical protein